MRLRAFQENNPLWSNDFQAANFDVCGFAQGMQLRHKIRKNAHVVPRGFHRYSFNKQFIFKDTCQLSILRWARVKALQACFALNAGWTFE
jgi:hypothetical protein